MGDRFLIAFASVVSGEQFYAVAVGGGRSWYTNEVEKNDLQSRGLLL